MLSRLEWQLMAGLLAMLIYWGILKISTILFILFISKHVFLHRRKRLEIFKL
jgi:hypothetical protein